MWKRKILSWARNGVLESESGKEEVGTVLSVVLAKVFEEGGRLFQRVGTVSRMVGNFKSGWSRESQMSEFEV